MASNTDTVKCGNCQYWTGSRNPVFAKNGTPKVDIIDTQGKSENEYSRRFCGKPRKQSLSCKHFSKWTELL